MVNERFKTLFADPRFWTLSSVLVADFAFWTLVANVRFLTLVAAFAF